MNRLKKFIWNIVFIILAIVVSIGAVNLTLKNNNYWFSMAGFIVSITGLLISKKIFKGYEYLEEVHQGFFEMIIFSIVTFFAVLTIAAIGTGTSKVSYILGIVAFAVLWSGYAKILFNLAWILYHLINFNKK